MKRSGFLKLLAALPFVNFERPEPVWEDLSGLPLNDAFVAYIDHWSPTNTVMEITDIDHENHDPT